MIAATALVAGPEAHPQLAEDAVRKALQKAGLVRASGVVLFLSRDFSRQAGHAVLAAARAAGCLQIVGMTVHGLFTEAGWILDQPAAAVLVLGGPVALSPAGSGHRLSFAESASLPLDWLQSGPRIGLLHSGGQVWQQSRICPDGRAEAVITGARTTIAISPGLRPLGGLQTVSAVRSYDLLRLDELGAQDALQRLLPADLRDRSSLPIHQLAVLPGGHIDQPAIPILAANGDGSITLAQPLAPGDTLTWALRQPLAAENDMRAALAAAARELPKPAFGIQFSCIGRGPLFYGRDDRDLAVWQERFPGVPLIGAYGSGQLGPHEGDSRPWHNTVVTALFSAKHV